MRQLVLSCALMVACSMEIFGQDSKVPLENKVVLAQEVLPEFPGGLDSLMTFIEKNLKYPSENTTKGNVVVGFSIDINGGVVDLDILIGLSEQCDKNALDVFRKMPRWTPGKIDGKPAEMRMAFPVTFE